MDLRSRIREEFQKLNLKPVFKCGLREIMEITNAAHMYTEDLFVCCLLVCLFVCLCICVLGYVFACLPVCLLINLTPPTKLINSNL